MRKYYKKRGIYKIIINNKIYIGSSINLYDRLKLHLSQLKRNVHGNKYLQRAYNKHKTFEFEILELYENIERKELIQEETRYMRLLKPHYNLILDPVLNTFTDEVKLRISNSVKRAYSEGRLINPWSLNGNYIDIYNYNKKLLHVNILVKEAIQLVGISNRSVINNAIRRKSYIVNNYIIIPSGANLEELLNISTSKYKHLVDV